MKRIRDTSAAVYRDLQPSLSRREQIVLDALRAWQGEAPTSYELTEYLKGQHQAFDLNSVRPRLTALSEKSLVVIGEKRTCRITGRTAYTWRVARVPVAEPEALELNFS